MGLDSFPAIRPGIRTGNTRSRGITVSYDDTRADRHAAAFRAFVYPRAVVARDLLVGWVSAKL